MTTLPAFAVYTPQFRADFATLEARVRVAEAEGYHSVWFMDHLEAPKAAGYDCLEAFTVATALAARSERIRFGFLTFATASGRLRCWRRWRPRST